MCHIEIVFRLYKIYGLTNTSMIFLGVQAAHLAFLDDWSTDGVSSIIITLSLEG